MNPLPAPTSIATGNPLYDHAQNPGDWNNLCVFLNFVSTQLWSMYVDTGFPNPPPLDTYVFDYRCPYHSWALEELKRAGWIIPVRRNQVPWKTGSYVEGGSTPAQKRELGQAYKLLYRIENQKEQPHD